MASGRETLIQQLDHLNNTLKQIDRLGLRITELPSPWPEMLQAKQKAANCMRVAFDEVVRYQRELINRLGPKDEELGAISTKVMEEAAIAKKPAPRKRRTP